MAPNVQSMFSVREVPWWGGGVILSDYPKTIEEGLKAASLDWDVEMVPLYYGKGNKLNLKEAKELKVLCRQYDQQFFGTATEKYKILQNRDAFSFVNHLLDNGARFETAGCLGNGSRVWVLAKLENYNLLGEEYTNYLLLVTSHDGTTSVKVCSVNIRVVCQNTLNLALDNAVRSWKTKHMFATTMQAKLLNASQALNLNNDYVRSLKEFAEASVQIKVTEDQVIDFVYKLFPDKDSDSKIAKDHNDLKREQLVKAMDADDLQNFKFTKWGIIQAVSDYAYHFDGVRKVKSIYETRMDDALNGSPILDQALPLLAEMGI